MIVVSKTILDQYIPFVIKSDFPAFNLGDKRWEGVVFELSILKFGWGNGYVAIPKNHPFYGSDFNTPELWDLEVHGGITFADLGERLFLSEKLKNKVSKMWVLGFDTGHRGSEIFSTEELVMEETLKLREQLIKIGQRTQK